MIAVSQDDVTLLPSFVVTATTIYIPIAIPYGWQRISELQDRDAVLVIDGKVNSLSNKRVFLAVGVMLRSTEKRSTRTFRGEQVRIILSIR